ncbi:MAG: hypothetical protein KBH93_00385 [Anaerolineae bacterium]|nr:hypothetical protein [Anaerolineae bacterium]
MKLPYSEQAVVPEEKLTTYLLDETHQEGRGKALFFQRFGFSVAQWEVLAQALLAHAHEHQVVKTEGTKFGTRYVVEGALATPVGRRPAVRVVWFIRSGESAPRLVTAYPVEDGNDQRT